jgi:hypothetical protein
LNEAPQAAQNDPVVSGYVLFTLTG